jgi:hypothetical protein
MPRILLLSIPRFRAESEYGKQFGGEHRFSMRRLGLPRKIIETAVARKCAGRSKAITTLR